MDSGVKISCGNITLEGRLNEQPGQKGVAICHPHPLYGGNMDNMVVMAIARAFEKKGFTTLRFNFRGTGNSTGMFDDGVGEMEDVAAALSFLSEQGYTDRYLAGYSFGARVNAGLVSKGCSITDHIMVSPPAGFMSFDGIRRMPDTGLIITGENDDIAPPAIIKEHISRWGISPRFEIIPDCDHFYSGSTSTLEAIIENYLA